MNGAIKLAKKYATNYIIEEFIDGRELTCAVHNFSKEKLITLPLTEIISITKYLTMTLIRQSNEITQQMRRKSAVKLKHCHKAYESLKLNGIVRFDFIVKKGIPYIIEVNIFLDFLKKVLSHK